MSSVTPTTTAGAYRVTHRSLGRTALTGLQGNLARLGRLQEQLSSGKSVARPSDSPTGALSALQLRAEIRTAEQHGRNAQDGLGWLGTVDTALSTSYDLAAEVRTLALQARSTGSASSPGATAAVAAKVVTLRDSLLGEANTRYLDRPVFGGTTAGSAAYDATTGAYVGDSTPVERTAAPGTRVRVDVTGPEAFGAAGEDLFGVVADIAKHVQTAPEALGGDLDRLDAAMARLQSVQAGVGARYARLEQLRQGADDRLLTMKTGLADVEDIDLPQTIVDLQMQQVSYQAALGATSRIVQPSLLDFLH